MGIKLSIVQPKGFIYIATKRFHIKTNIMRRDVFQAIADPTRRQILSMIAYGPLNINSVSEKFDISRAAIYKHVKILRESGLVVVKQHGRERYCEAHLEKLSAVSNWIEQYRKFWNAKLDSLEAYLEKLQKEDKGLSKSKISTKKK